MQRQAFKGVIEKNIDLDYLLHLPKGYDESRVNGYPFILFLHGSGERGNDLSLVKNEGLMAYIESHEDFPFITVAPQCKETSWWTREMDGLYALVNKVKTLFNIDKTRMYLTGLSMGGFGCWHFAEKYPNIFTAMIPICGGTEKRIAFPERIEVLKDMPIWAFHGKKDSVVPVEETRQLFPYLGQNTIYTEYLEGTHNVWTRTYNNEDIYKWLLSHQKPSIDLD